MERKDLKQTKRWVIKVGSALVTNSGRGLDHEKIAQWTKQMVALREQGVEVTLVSSGAVAEGMKRLGWRSRPHALFELQAAAAVGQAGLVQAYENAFREHGMGTAQVLLTHDDLADRQRYLNARSTLRHLVSLGVVPVVNENDTVANDEIRFGDNDTLAALVANLVEADLLVILTDQDGLFDKDPRSNPDAKLVRLAEAGDSSLEEMATGKSGALGRGGMLTKVVAAQRAARSGAATVIAHGGKEDVLLRLREAEELGTLLVAKQQPLAARKQWLASHLQVAGALVVDDGAAKVLKESGRSLLPVGVVEVQGKFDRGQPVRCIDQQGNEIARGLVNYSSEETDQIKGKVSAKVEEILGYVDEPELIHRDNLVLM